MTCIKCRFVSCSDEDGSKHFLVDFEQKTLAARAQRRQLQQQKQEMARDDQQKLDDEDRDLVPEKEDEEPENPDEQWLVTVPL